MVLSALALSCTYHPVQSPLSGRNFIERKTEYISVETSLEEVQEIFAGNGFKWVSSREGVRTEPKRIDPVTWVIFRVENRHNSQVISSFWARAQGRQTTSNNGNDVLADTLHIPGLRKFQPVVFRKRGRRPDHVVEYLVSLIEKSEARLFVDELLSEDGVRGYRKVTYEVEPSSPADEIQIIEQFEREKKRMEMLEKERSEDAAFSINRLPLTCCKGYELKSLGTRDLWDLTRGSMKMDWIPTARSRESSIEVEDLSGETRYLIQFFASSTAGKKFEEVGKLGEITVEKIPGKEIYRYLLGYFFSPEEAERVISRLKELGYVEAFVYRPFN